MEPHWDLFLWNVTQVDDVHSCSHHCHFHHIIVNLGYWEVQVGKLPQGQRIGVRRYNPKEPVSLDKFLEDDAWYMRCDDCVTGDVIGVYWDQTDFPMLGT